MKHLFEEIEHLFGWGLHFKVWLIANICGINLAFLFHLVNKHVEVWIWSPALTYYLILGLVGLDFLTGALVAWRKDKFETRKALRSIFKALSYTILLAIAHNLGRTERTLSWMPEVVMFPTVIILFLSLLKNMSLLGWIDKRLASILYKKIDAYKNPGEDK